MSMADRDGVIWYDGKMVPWRDANTHVLTHTLHYGLGVFEGLRAYQTAQGSAEERERRRPSEPRLTRLPVPRVRVLADPVPRQSMRPTGWPSRLARTG